MCLHLQRDTYSGVRITETEIIYLKEKSPCSDVDGSFYDCLFPKVLPRKFETCQQRCLPLTIKAEFNLILYEFKLKLNSCETTHVCQI